MVKDIRAGAGGSYPTGLVAVGNTVYFTADDGSGGTELWRSNGTSSGTVNANNVVLYATTQSALRKIDICGSAKTACTLSVDFSFGGVFAVPTGIGFWASPTRTDGVLKLIGTNGDDAFQIATGVCRIGETPVQIANVATVDIDARDGDDHVTILGGASDDAFAFAERKATFQSGGTTFHANGVTSISLNASNVGGSATVVSPESNGIFRIADTAFVMQAGGQRVELQGLDRINAFADGLRDTTYVYARNNALVFMNDQYVECRSNGRSYRVWRSEHVIATNADTSNNAVLHHGSRTLDLYVQSTNYGSATNANATYHHEWLGFNKTAVATTDTITDALFAHLAEEQQRINKKPGEIFNDTDNWLADFEALALRELRK